MSLTAGGSACGQVLNPSSEATSAPNPLIDPTVKPGKMILFDLEARFAKDVLERGGAAFADWFAEDGVALGNGQSPVVGKVAIAKSAGMGPQGLPTYLDPDRRDDGAVWRCRVHLGTL